MDKQEYLALVALLEDLLALTRCATREEAEYAKPDLRKIEGRLTKAVDAYRETANAHRA